MQHIDSQQINHDLPARVSYLQSFLLFEPATDGPLLNSTKPVLAPILDVIVDSVYDHLLEYDITAAPFARAQTSDQQSVGVSQLDGFHENIKFRKDFLKRYLIKLVDNTDWTPESRFWDYLDRVAKAHTGAIDSGLKWRLHKPKLLVSYREISLLLGWVQNAVMDIVMGLDNLDLETRLKVVRALNKYWWLQNDLFARHYTKD